VRRRSRPCIGPRSRSQDRRRISDAANERRESSGNQRTIAKSQKEDARRSSVSLIGFASGRCLIRDSPAGIARGFGPGRSQGVPPTPTRTQRGASAFEKETSYPSLVTSSSRPAWEGTGVRLGSAAEAEKRVRVDESNLP